MFLFIDWLTHNALESMLNDCCFTDGVCRRGTQYVCRWLGPIRVGHWCPGGVVHIFKDVKFGGTPPTEGISSDVENDLLFSEEESEHIVENFMLCSFAHLACSPLVQGFQHTEELCKVALTTVIRSSEPWFSL